MIFVSKEESKEKNSHHILQVILSDTNKSFYYKTGFKIYFICLHKNVMRHTLM